MREHDKSADMPLGYAQNDNKRPIRVLVWDGLGWNVNHFANRAEALALIDQERQQGVKVEAYDPNTDEVL